LEKQEKNWKFSTADMKERIKWAEYQFCYEDAINKTSTDYAPWYIIPADDKATSRYIVAKILFDILKTYTDIQEPEMNDEIKAHLKLYQQQLRNE
jgi:polyphosphate kinase 2 (PPK2 family)